jgi:hypothetical protein
MALISLGEWIDRHGDQPGLGGPEPYAGPERRRTIREVWSRIDFLHSWKRFRALQGVHIVLSRGCDIAGTRTRLL